MHKQRITQEIEQQNMQLGYLVGHFNLTWYPFEHLSSSCYTTAGARG